MHLEGRAREIHLTVINRGDGISPEHLDRIFDRFYQVDGSRYAGLGLGLCPLPLDRRDHHGTIVAESAPGQGATFRAILPRTPPA